MQGHKEIIAVLNHLLAGELAARDQYFIHARMYENWGFAKLGNMIGLAAAETCVSPEGLPDNRR